MSDTDVAAKRQALLELRLERLRIQKERTRVIRRRARGKGPPPLTFAQQGLWFLDQWAPGQQIYNIPWALRLKGPLHVAALEEALNEIVRRHESLRTTFSSDGGVPYQVIAPSLEVPLPLTDLTALGPQEREDEVGRLVTEEARRPFDLEQGPLFRAGLLRLGDQEHVLVLNVHHIASDGWSFGVLTQEMAGLYEAFSAGRPSPLPELPIQYADFALWQREWLAGEARDEQVRYWKERLADLPVLEMPTDRPRPDVLSYRGAMTIQLFPPDLARGVNELSRREGVTLYMTLLAAFQVLLHRYTGQDDVVVGSPIAGRSRPEIEPLIGFFINMLVLRTDLSGDPSFRELLGRVKEVVLGAFSHQDVPFQLLVEELRPERDPSRNPLFQVGVALQYAPGGTGDELSLAGLTAEGMQLDLGTSRFDLSFNFFEGPEELAVWVEYSTDLFDRPRIERMIRHLEQVFRAAIDTPDLPLSHVPLLDDGERRNILEWSQGADLNQPREPVHAQVAAMAAAHSDQPAVRFGDADMSYGELDRRAGLLARRLRAMGVRHQDMVAVALDAGFDVVVGLLGVMKAGAAFVPIDVKHPARRLAYILEDTGAKVVVTRAEFLPLLPEPSGWTALCLDAEWASIESESPSGGPWQEWADQDSLAYVLYTSGSTGKPKGVMIEHHALTTWLLFFRELFGLGPGHRTIQHMAFIFDFTMGEIFAVLTSGATLVMVPEEHRTSPEAIGDLLAGERITHVCGTPAVFGAVGGGPYPDLVGMVLGGEAFSGEMVNRWNAPGRRVINGYGPTEAAIGCIFYECEHRTWRTQPPIGRSMPGRCSYVLDRWENLAPVGVPGEIVVGGAGLARGYLNQPDLTAQRFVPDPIRPGGRIYRTGDLGVWTEDGQIRFLGRMDTQVKLRGLRIELGEIESVLVAHPGVAEATVAVREDSPGNRRLVAYLVAEPGATPTVTDLRAFLGQDLPGYMIPSAFVFMDALPLAPSGKVDRAALPAPEAARPDLDEAFLAPRTPTEAVLASIFAQVLGVPEVGVNDAFFELGGNSLQATQVLSRIKDALGATVTLRNLYTAPTVASVAEVIEAAWMAAEGPPGGDGDAARWRLLSQVEGLSEEQVDRLLEQRIARRGAPRPTEAEPSSEERPP